MLKKHSRNISLILLVVGTAFWGMSFVFVKEGTQIIDLYVFLTYRFLIASVLLAIVYFYRLKLMNISVLIKGSVAGLMLFSSILTQTIGLKTTTASNAAFISGLALLFVPVFKWLLFGQKLQLKILLVMVLALVGLAIITLNEHFTFSIGDIWELMCAVLFALYIIVVGRYSLKTDPILLTLVQLSFTGLISLFITILWHLPLGIPLNGELWKAILFTAILSTAFMYVVQNIAQQHISEEKVAIVFLFEPVFACIAAYYFLSEPITYRIISGGSLIIIALALAELPLGRARK